MKRSELEQEYSPTAAAQSAARLAEQRRTAALAHDATKEPISDLGELNHWVEQFAQAHGARIVRKKGKRRNNPWQ